MRVHVISDMEGVSGIVKPEQCDGGDPMFADAQKLYTQEINAAVRGAKEAGATEIVVMDCHGAGGGWTFNSLIEVGESAINAALCGTWGCPVLLVTGDQACAFAPR